MVSFLLNYDALAFHAYLETIIASNTRTDGGHTRQNQSPWLLTDAAHTIFVYAKRRCYTMSTTKSTPGAPPPAVDPTEDEEAWAALDEIEGGQTWAKPDALQNAEESSHPWWLPKGMDPVLEELPKWDLLADVLQEIEQEMMRLESHLPSRA